MTLLPAYVASPEQVANPQLYADNVQDFIGRQLKLSSDMCSKYAHFKAVFDSAEPTLMGISDMCSLAI
eukprot:SAG31_NODE_17426_length_671_cov_0.725524_2_plen_67_part_01